MSSQDNDYSLVDSLIFIDSQDYRYRCLIDDHTEESLMDVVANIALIVESLALMKLWVTILGGCFGGTVSSPFILIYFRLATI